MIDIVGDGTGEMNEAMKWGHSHRGGYSESEIRTMFGEVGLGGVGWEDLGDGPVLQKPEEKGGDWVLRIFIARGQKPGEKEEL